MSKLHFDMHKCVHSQVWSTCEYKSTLVKQKHLDVMSKRGIDVAKTQAEDKKKQTWMEVEKEPL